MTTQLPTLRLKNVKEMFTLSDHTMKWIRAAGIRAVKTVAQTAVAMLPAAATIAAVDWVTVIGTAALAGVMSLLTSLAGLPEVEDENDG